jgi:hypothetical protein
MKMRLEPGYGAEVDSVDKESWESLLRGFDDANIYQTWSYEAVISGEKKVSRLVLKKGGVVTALAQVRLVKVPFTPFGAAHIRGGPVWRRKGERPSMEIFRQALRALRNEYACKRRLVVRILPSLFNHQAGTFDPILEEEGFDRLSLEPADRTLLIRLDKDVDQLRRGLDQKWRNRLNYAERQNLDVMEGDEDLLFSDFIDIYDEMHARKRFVKTSDVRQFREMQEILPTPLRMRVSMAYYGKNPAAGLICSPIGDTGVCLFAATANAGLNSQASYLLQWRTLCWLREKGVKWYDLNGISPQANPGTYRFKAGLCGKNGADLRHLGTYVSHENAIASKVIWLANVTRNQYRKSRRIVTSLVYQPGGKEGRRKTG